MSVAMQTRLTSTTSALGLFAGAVLLAFASSGCGQKTEAQGPSGPPAMPVQVEIARSIRIPETTEYLSVLKSRQSAMINPQVEGQVTKIYVKSGDSVSAGTPLLQIDPLKQKATVSGQEAARAAQEATMQLAKVNFERSQKLFAAGVISKQDLDSAQSSYDSAQAQLKSLSDQVEQQRVELRYYDVSAPVDGILGDIPVRIGDRVTVSTLLTTVNLPGALEAYIYVPGDRAKDLRLGLPVTLLDENGNAVSETHITFVSPQVETDTQTVLAKAEVSNPRAKLRISQQVRAEVTWGSHEGPVVPILAITRINGQSFAFVAVHDAKGTVARQKLLKLGDTIGNDYAVLDGLKAGDHIIVSGTQFLQDGAPVLEQIQKDVNNSTNQGAATP
ncbi:MAG TPA: efflux RND transporter periplasmic adaptor subunit [Candidatus Acidoferrum sp.]|nr:efflux RND transporter periplasmic adaptor subunit [Candidatus Acidoferrum sp.]